MKKNILIAMLVLGILVLLNVIRLNAVDEARYKSNIRALNNKVDSLKNKEGEWYHRTEVLQYNISELKSYNEDLLREIKSLKIRPKDVQYVSGGTVTIHVKDTVYLEADDYGVYYGTWSDPWTTAYFECKDSVLKFDYRTQDSLQIILYGQKDKFNIFHPFRKRITQYYTIAKLTRPNAELIVKSVQFK